MNLDREAKAEPVLSASERLSNAIAENVRLRKELAKAREFIEVLKERGLRDREPWAPRRGEARGRYD